MSTASNKRKIKVGRFGSRYDHAEVNSIQEFELDELQSGHHNPSSLSMPKLTHFVLEGSRLISPRSKSKPLMSSDTTISDSLDYEVNQDVPSYQTGQFLSSTVLKKVSVPKRHMDTFGGIDLSQLSKRGVMLHTDRYQLDFLKSMDSASQKERLQAGMEYMESVRGTRRKREMLPHRAEFDLFMGGKQIEFEERFNLNREIQKLKAIAMPTHAKDLYHGRGIRLPSNHMSLKPRHPLPNDVEEEMTSSSTNSFHLPSRTSEHFQNQFPRLPRDLTSLDRSGTSRNTLFFQKHSRLPSITSRTDFSGTSVHNSSAPWSSVTWTDDSQQDPRISMFQERRTVSNLSARLGFPGRLHRDVIPLSRAQSQGSPHGQDQAIIKQKNRFLTRGTAEQMSPKRIVKNVYNHQPSKDSKAPENEQTDYTNLSELPVHHEKTNDELYTTNESEVLNTGTENIIEDKINNIQLPKEVDGQTYYRLQSDDNKQLPKNFSVKEKEFMEKVAETMKSGAFLGINEFVDLKNIDKIMEDLSGKATEAFEELDLATLNQDLEKYMSQFQENDTSSSGKLSIDQLRKILSTTISAAFNTQQDLWDKMLELVSFEYSDQITKSSYIAHIPLFLSVEKEHRGH